LQSWSEWTRCCGIGCYTGFGMRILKNVSTNLASSVEWVKASCRSVRAAKEPNPYKDWSDEQIAEMILKEMIDE